MRRLDAEAEVYVFLIAGVGVEVIGRPVVELVAQPKFAAYKQAQSHGSKTGRDPADRLDEGRFLIPARGEIFGSGG